MTRYWRGIRAGAAPDRADAGSATVWLLAGMLASGAICSAWVIAGLAGTARQRAETAADLAALAGAQHAAAAGVPGTCSAAGAVARRNGAVLESCTVDGSSVTVRVGVRGPLAARASARAGLAVS